MAQPVREIEASFDATPARQRPIGGYLSLLGAFAGLAGGFAAWLRGSGRELPERMAPGDLALIAVATHKASRLIARDRVASPVRAPFTAVAEPADPNRPPRERPRGEGLRRAVGELVLCPFCLSVWIATAFAAGLVVAPRPTRWVAAILTAVFGSDVLQIAYRRAAGAG